MLYEWMQMSQRLLFDMASIFYCSQSDIEKRTSISDTHMRGRLSERVKVKSTILRWIIVWFIKHSDGEERRRGGHNAQGAELTSSDFVVNHWLFHFRNTFGIQSDSSSSSSIFVWSSSSSKEINSYSHSVVCHLCYFCLNQLISTLFCVICAQCALLSPPLLNQTISNDGVCMWRWFIRLPISLIRCLCKFQLRVKTQLSINGDAWYTESDGVDWNEPKNPNGSTSMQTNTHKTQIIAMGENRFVEQDLSSKFGETLHFVCIVRLGYTALSILCGNQLKTSQKFLFFARRLSFWLRLHILKMKTELIGQLNDVELLCK